MWCSVVFLALATSPTASPEGGGVPLATERVRFLGFSANDQLAAWETEVEIAGDGYTDRYRLAEVGDVETGQVLHAYGLGKPSRVDDRGRKVRVPRAAWRASYPRLAQVSPESQWRKIRRSAKFGFKPLDASDSCLRLSPDYDSAVTAEATAEAITVRGETGGVLGYRTVIRRLDGGTQTLARVRVEAQLGWRYGSRVQAFHSASGYAVAVVHRLTARSAGDRPLVATERIQIERMRGSPVGTTRIGSMRSSMVQLRLGEELFKHAHPETGGLYDKFVRTTW